MKFLFRLYICIISPFMHGILLQLFNFFCFCHSSLNYVSIIFFFFQIPLLLNGHRGMMFPTGLTKVLRMANDGLHIHILLLLIYKNQSPYTERLPILSSNGSCNTNSNIALVNLFLTGLINSCMIVKLLKLTGDGRRIHIPPFHT